jgi:hypothetical protein
MAERSRMQTLSEFREETEDLPGDTKLMMIDPNDGGHFVQISHGEVRKMDEEDWYTDQEDYFDENVVAKEDAGDEHNMSVLVFYAAHD